MHLSPGEIRAFQDQELPEAQRQRAAEHLASCPRCQTAAQEVSPTSCFVPGSQD